MIEENDIDNIGGYDKDEEDNKKISSCVGHSCSYCHPFDFCDCFNKDIQGIAACLQELKHVAKCVFKCMDCQPSQHGLQRIQICILLNEIRNLEEFLTNDIFGLEEIKNEVRFIENGIIDINEVINNGNFGLVEIKNEIIVINEVVNTINNIIGNGNFGIFEIKNEIIEINDIVTDIFNQIVIVNDVISDIINEVVNAINDTVNNGTKGIFEIKNEIIEINDVVVAINNTVNNGEKGIFEIKNEIIGINDVVVAINNTVNNGEKGIFEIKNEIIAINEAISNLNNSGLINNVIVEINNTVNNGEKGIFEIKNEIIEINDTLQIINNNTQCGFTGSITSGPMLHPPGMVDITVKVLNNNTQNRTVNVRIYDLNTCPKSFFGNHNMTVSTCCANEVLFESIPSQYEIQVRNVIPGLYVFSTVTMGGTEAVIISTLRQSEWVPLIGNATC